MSRLVVRMQTVYTFNDAVTSFDRSHVRAMIRRGVWQKPVTNVYVTHNGPLSAKERLDVALAACGTGAVLGGLSALEVEEFEGAQSTRPVVVMPIGARRPCHLDVIPHWSSKLGREDVHPDRKPRRTRPARSLVDAASWAGSDVAARLIIISGIQQGFATTRSLREALTRRGTCRRRALIVESILDAAGGIQSLPERDFGHMIARLHLPRPTRQRPVRARDGRYYLDADWTDLGVAAEVHGIPHLSVGRWDSDLHRGNEVVIEGRRVVQFSSFGVRHRQNAVGDQLRRLLLSAGWLQKSARW
jgi:hypothetical protein